MAISVWIKPASFYPSTLPLSRTSVSFFLLITFTAYSMSVFLFTHCVSLVSHAYAIHGGEASLADLLANVVEVFDVAHLRHVADPRDPLVALALTRRVELAVVGGRELHAEAEVAAALVRLVGDPTLARESHAHGDTVAFSIDTTVDGASE